MNNKHLEDFLDLSDDLNIKTEDLISEYTALAIKFSSDGFSPKSFDYDLAYSVVYDKYNSLRCK